MEKDKLFKLIKVKLPKNVSFIEEISDVLNISYDASYRRVKGKTVLSLKEGVLLSNYYNINLNDVSVSIDKKPEKIIVEKSHHIISDNFLHTFFDKAEIETQKVLNSKKGLIINSAKDFAFYHVDNGVLKKFKLFLFINVLSKNKELKKTTFNNFNPSEDILVKYNTFIDQYRKVSLIEIWNDTTIDNILNQIKYFFDVGLTTKKEATSIANGLIEVLQKIELQAKNKIRDESSGSFHLYHNNLISLLNTIVMKTDVDKSVFVPFTNLSYFKVTDKNTTDQIEEHLKTQLEFSNNLSGNAAVDRKKFFTSMYQKIDNLKVQIYF